MSEPGLIYQQIPKIMADIDAVAKDRDNKVQGFKFRGIDDVINELHSKLAKHSVFIVPEVLETERKEGQSKSGGVINYVTMKIRYTFTASDGSFVSAIMIGEAMDTGDKASNKAQSVALKYALLQVFAIPTVDDKDPDEESPEIAPGSLAPDSSQGAVIVAKFRKLGVSEAAILAKYAIKEVSHLTVKHITELNKIGSSMVNQNIPASEFFPRAVR